MEGPLYVFEDNPLLKTKSRPPAVALEAAPAEDEPVIRVTRKLTDSMMAFANSRTRASGVGLSDSIGNLAIDDEAMLGRSIAGGDQDDREKDELALCSPVLRKASFLYSSGLTTEEANRRLLKFGRNELPEKVVPKWYIFVSQLWQPMPIMIWIGTLAVLFFGT